MVIYKYLLPGAGGTETIPMPERAKIVKVGMQGLNICMWAMVDPHAPTEERVFYVVGTGWDFSEYAKYIGTVFDEPYVWHVLENVM